MNSIAALAAIAYQQSAIAAVAAYTAISTVADPARTASTATDAAIAAIAVDQAAIGAIADAIACISSIAKQRLAGCRIQTADASTPWLQRPNLLNVAVVEIKLDFVHHGCGWINVVGTFNLANQTFLVKPGSDTDGLWC